MIKKFKDFILEEVSGTELVGPIGPAYGETRLQNKTINSFHTNVIHLDLTGEFYTIDDYNQMYNDYLKKGGKPLDGFNRENLEIIIEFMN